MKYEGERRNNHGSTNKKVGMENQIGKKKETKKNVLKRGIEGF